MHTLVILQQTNQLKCFDTDVIDSLVRESTDTFSPNIFPSVLLIVAWTSKRAHGQGILSPP